MVYIMHDCELMQSSMYKELSRIQESNQATHQLRLQNPVGQAFC